MEPIWTKFSEYGLIGIIIGILFYILWRMLVWVMKWVDKQSEQHNMERQVWIKALEGITQTIVSINQSVQSHIQSSIENRRVTEEAHRFQRSEHEKMLDELVEMNTQTKITTETLKRINGHKE